MRGIKVFFSFLFAGFMMVTVLSGNAAAYTKNIVMESFQQTSGLTGEIYYHWSTPPTPYPYSYCIDQSISMTVNNTSYYAEKVSIAGNENLLEAAYLMDKYAYSKNGLLPGYISASLTGAIVQLAIWAVIENTTISGTGLYAVAEGLRAEAETKNLTDLDGLANRYIRLDVYEDSSKLKSYQDLLTPNPVPIPAAFWLFGTGLLGLFGVRRKMRK